MNPRLPILLIALLLFCTAAQAQTQWIAHQSHGGSTNTFTTDGDDNLGNPGTYKLVKVKRLSPTVVVQEHQYFYFGSGRQGHAGNIDTVYNHPEFSNPAISVDSLRRLYPEVKFEGYPIPHQRRRNGIFVAPVGGGTSGPSGPQWLAVVITLFSLLTGYFLWRTVKRQRPNFTH